MKIEIDIPDKRIEEMAKGIMENFPENAVCLRCTSWKYDKGIFKFYDDEEDKEYTVTTKDIEKILPQFISKCFQGKYKFFGDNFNIFDLGNWDCWPIDGIVQEVIFGDVIYG